MEPKAAPEQEAEAEAAADEVRPPAMSYHMGIFYMSTFASNALHD